MRLTDPQLKSGCCHKRHVVDPDRDSGSRRGRGSRLLLVVAVLVSSESISLSDLSCTGLGLLVWCDDLKRSSSGLLLLVFQLPTYQTTLATNADDPARRQKLKSIRQDPLCNVSGSPRAPANIRRPRPRPPPAAPPNSRARSSSTTAWTTPSDYDRSHAGEPRRG